MPWQLLSRLAGDVSVMADTKWEAVLHRTQTETARAVLQLIDVLLVSLKSAPASLRRAKRGRDSPITPGSSVTVGKQGRPVRLGESPNSYQGRAPASPHQQGRAELKNPGAGSEP
jgi:hypothetical protein